MLINNLYCGYDREFLSTETDRIILDLPSVNVDHQDDVFKTFDSPNGIFNYANYSLQMSISRRLAFFSAANIDGNIFKKVPRRDSWKRDSRVGDFQLGMKLYSAPLYRFDRGHLTKREDVQWGSSSQTAYNAANSTFYFTNAVPQHKKLNRNIWRSLEDYILHKETTSKGLKISVFTGPVLMKNDPFFIIDAKKLHIQIPLYFWKVVFFKKNDGMLYRVGFLMCQKKLLQEDGIVEELEIFADENKLFQEFSKAATYQVNISLIEQITNITFPIATDSYIDDRSKELVLTIVDVDSDLENYSMNSIITYEINNIVL